MAYNLTVLESYMSIVAYVHKYQDQFVVIVDESSTSGVHFMHNHTFDTVERACKMRDRILKNRGICDYIHWQASVSKQTPKSVKGTARISNF